MKKYIKPALKVKAIVEEQHLAAPSGAVQNPTGGHVVTLEDGGYGDGTDAAAKDIWM